MSSELSTFVEYADGTAAITATTAQAIALAGAVLDKKIATAKQWPRSVSAFKDEAISLLQSDIETARSAKYSKPVGAGTVTGPSVRLAEIAAYCWGNLEIKIDEPVISETSVTVTAHVWDLQRNASFAGIASTSIIDKTGKRYKQNMIDNVIMSTASKARRNAIHIAIPRAYINELLAAADEVALKHQKPLNVVRVEMLEFFKRTYRILEQQVFDYLKVQGVDDIEQKHIDELRAVVTAIKDGEPVEDYFGTPKTKSQLMQERLEQRQAKGDKPVSEVTQ